jgi:hypothetical protein
MISIARDFSPSPAGRYRTDGPFPGQAFRDDILIPALKNFANITVDLDGTSGFGSSFLEEAFGGLVRNGFTESELKKKLHIKSSRPSYEVRIWKYIHSGQA